MDDLDVRFSTPHDFEELKLQLRQVDKDEAKALSGMSPADLVEVSARQPGVSFAVRREMDLVGVFGFCDGAVLGRRARPWFMGTDLLQEHSPEFLRRSRHFVDYAIQNVYLHMENIVWAENRSSKVYLKALGFTIDPPVANSRGFRVQRFHMTRETADV